MLFLIFPKSFEYAKFKIELGQYLNFTYDNNNLVFDVYIINTPQGNFAFCAYLVGKSDIEFLLKLNEFIIKLKENFKSDVTRFNFMIFGTCGSFGSYEVNDALYIVKAIKYDRGTLGKNRTFSGRKKEITAYANSAKNLHFVHSMTFSGNMLCTSERETLTKFFSEIEKDNSGIVEMETFDFFKICDNHELRCIGGIRIVSDRCDGEDNKLCRLFCTFKNGIQYIHDIIHHLTYYKYNSKNYALHILPKELFKITSIINDDLVSINLKIKDLTFDFSGSKLKIDGLNVDYKTFILNEVEEDYQKEYFHIIRFLQDYRIDSKYTKITIHSVLNVFIEKVFADMKENSNSTKYLQNLNGEFKTYILKYCSFFKSNLAEVIVPFVLQQLKSIVSVHGISELNVAVFNPNDTTVNETFMDLGRLEDALRRSVIEFPGGGARDAFYGSIKVLCEKLQRKFNSDDILRILRDFKEDNVRMPLVMGSRERKSNDSEEEFV